MTGIKVKSLFFDSPKIKSAVGAAERRVLSKVGAFVRQRARSLLGRKTRQVAAAGKPPNTHEGSLRKLLFFSYDLSARSVVIGPTPFRDGTAPRLLEFGGRTTRRVGNVTKTLIYRPHPFMGPALAAEVQAGTIPRAWAGSVRS